MGCVGVLLVWQMGRESKRGRGREADGHGGRLAEDESFVWRGGGKEECRSLGLSVWLAGVVLLRS